MAGARSEAPEVPRSRGDRVVRGRSGGRDGVLDRRTTDGLELPNSAYDVTNLAGSLHVNLTAICASGAIVKRLGHRGGSVSRRNSQPARKTTVDTTTIAVPISLRLGGHGGRMQGIYAKDEPTFDDPEGSFGYTHSDSQARRAGGRFSLGHVAGAHRLSLGTDYERVTVTSRDSYGTNLDGESLHTFSVFAEDRISVLKDRLDVTAGVRWDDHSAFGSHVSPRLTAAYRASASWKLRASVGGAFRSPTTGELFFPFSGNPDLKPETSVAYEAGVEWKVLPPSSEMALFTQRHQGADPVRLRLEHEQNVGRARD
jgi:outer membrane receptor protein involved in Fe transport